MTPTLSCSSLPAQRRIESTQIEASTLNHRILERDSLRVRIKSAQAEAERAANEAGQDSLLKDRAEQDVAIAQRALEGKSKGWRILKWKSQSRRVAEGLEENLARKQFLLTVRDQDHAAIEHARGIREREAFELEFRLNQLERHLRILGTDEELAKALDLFEDRLSKDLFRANQEDLDAALENDEITQDQYDLIERKSGNDEEELGPEL